MTDIQALPYMDDLRPKQAVAKKDMKAEKQRSFYEDPDNMLKLFMAQMKNQDPLNPVEEKDSFMMFAQMGQVQQMREMNSHLLKLLETSTMNKNTEALNLINHTAEIETDRFHFRQSPKLSQQFQLPETANAYAVQVKDADGHVLFDHYAQATPGLQTFEWSGLDKQGRALEAGAYSLTISAYNGTRILNPVTDASGAAIQDKAIELKNTTDKTTFVYALPQDTQGTSLQIVDKSGKTIYTESGNMSKGKHAFSWDGRMQNGAPAPEGVYQLKVIPKDHKGQPIPEESRPKITISLRGEVTGIERTPHGNVNVMTKQLKIPMEQVKAIVKNELA